MSSSGYDNVRDLKVFRSPKTQKLKDLHNETYFLQTDNSLIIH